MVGNNFPRKILKPKNPNQNFKNLQKPRLNKFSWENFIARYKKYFDFLFNFLYNEMEKTIRLKTVISRNSFHRLALNWKTKDRQG
jgi:hypothetical protein